ncbi:MAG: hypothetical protein IH822_10030 [Chloroflexi bacterium]|nr:hypothetical protein [Chloroflexota bacterium]
MTTIQEVYRRLHPRSARLHQEAVKTFPSGVTHDIRHLTPFPLYVDHAQGSRTSDVDGNAIVDAGEVVLLVEDDPIVRKFSARVLVRTEAPSRHS